MDRERESRLRAETAQEVLSTSWWGEFCDEIDYRIRSLELKLRYCPLDQVKVFQQRIAQLEEVKKIPQDAKKRQGALD